MIVGEAQEVIIGTSRKHQLAGGDAFLFKDTLQSSPADSPVRVGVLLELPFLVGHTLEKFQYPTELLLQCSIFFPINDIECYLWVILRHTLNLGLALVVHVSLHLVVV